jgi:hypothetical protein
MTGVPSSHIIKTLSYDSLGELMKEAHLYGLVVDESLGEPKFRFGQKHYKTKLSVFREPITNPSQRRSMTVVEPKKYDFSLKYIISGTCHSLN